MFMKNYYLIMMFFLASSVVMSASSNSWFIMWMGMEINLMSFIPLILNENKSEKSEAVIKYFIPQAFASSILILSFLTEMYMFNTWSMMNMSTIILLALITKAGMAPFHQWFPQVMKKIEYTQCIILTTVQKITPMIMVFMIMKFHMTIISIILSSMAGAIGGINQKNLKIIMTFSSISHSAWMLASLYISMMSWMIYFLIYCLISSTMFLMFNMMNWNSVSSIFFSNMSKLNMTMIMMCIMSMGGLPPFLGFAAKMSVLFNIIYMMNLLTVFVMIMGSLITLFYYLKMTYSFMFNMNKNMHIKKNTQNKKFNFLMMLILSLNTMSPLFVMLM